MIITDAARARADEDRRAYGHDLREASAGEFTGCRGGIAHWRSRRLRRRNAHPRGAIRQRGATHSASGTVAAASRGLQGGRYLTKGTVPRLDLYAFSYLSRRDRFRERKFCRRAVFTVAIVNAIPQRGDPS